MAEPEHPDAVLVGATGEVRHYERTGRPGRSLCGVLQGDGRVMTDDAVYGLGPCARCIRLRERG